MKRFIKVAAGLIAFIAVILVGIYLYWDREQKINFAKMLPEELEHCGRTIGRDTAEYIELKEWFKTNQKGWRNTPVTYVPKQTYSSPKLSVNVMVGGVVVNYEAKSGRWSQVIKRIEKDELPSECQNANKSLLPTPLTPLAFAPGVKGSLAALGAAEFNR